MQRLPLLLFLLATAPTIVRATESGVPLDEVVAIVDTRLILRSELEVEASLLRAKQQGGDSLSRPIDGQALAGALSFLIDQLVLYQEAQRLQVFELSEKETTDGVKKLRQTLGAKPYDAFVAAYDVDEKTIEDIVQRDLRVQRYLEGRFRLASKPKDPEIATYFQAHAGEFKGRTLAQATGDVKLRLARERFDQLAAAFVADVRKRAHVRILRNYAADGAVDELSGESSAATASGSGG